MKGKTRWIAAAVVILSAAIAIAYARSRHPHVSSQQFAAMTQLERNLAVYDAFVENLQTYYFDRELLGSAEWQKILAEFREKAAGATDSNSLYYGVLFQVSQKFPHSHVSATPPLPAAPSVKKALPAGDAEPTRVLEIASFGFDYAQLRRNNGVTGWVVGDVTPGSAAERAGVTPGWALGNFALNANSTTCTVKGDFFRLSRDLALQRERGATFTLSSAGTPPDEAAATEAIRQHIEFDCEHIAPVPSFETQLLANAVTYIRFDGFLDVPVIDRVIAAIDAAGPAGLIVDLRHNNGGRADQMQRVLGRLIGPDAYIGTFRKGIGSWRIRNFRTEKDARGYAGPVAVLIGPMTASAAEITAAAVLDNQRGHVVGRWSAGAVLSTQEYPLPDGGSCHIPIEDFVRGGDRRIEGIGVAPDVVVMPTLAEVRSGRDVALDRAAEGLH